MASDRERSNPDMPSEERGRATDEETVGRVDEGDEEFEDADELDEDDDELEEPNEEA